MSRERPDDLDRGAARRRQMLGEAWVERSLGQANSLNAEFQSLVTRHAWHDIWNRPGLDDQTRRLLVLGMTMGQARWEEFELHCRAALRGGVPLAAIKETLMQGAIYCGVPAANTAFKLTAAICQAEGMALDPAPLTDGPLPFKYGMNLTNGTPMYRRLPTKVERRESEATPVNIGCKV